MTELATTTEQPAPAPKPASIPLVLPAAQWTTPADGFKPYPLSTGVTVEGRAFSIVGIRRFTMAQMRAVVENYRLNLDIGAEPPALPVYVDEAGQDLPLAVLDALTPDDFDALDEATAAFLPRRMRPTAVEETSGASIPQDGSSTEQ